MKLQTVETKDRLSEIYSKFNTTSSGGADKLLYSVKAIVRGWMDESNLVDEIRDDELVSLYEFLVLKLEYVNGIKESLQISTCETTQFIDLELSLSLLESEDGVLTHEFDELLYNKLSSNISNINEQLIFYFSVIKKIMVERKCFRVD